MLINVSVSKWSSHNKYIDIIYSNNQQLCGLKTWTSYRASVVACMPSSENRFSLLFTNVIEPDTPADVLPGGLHHAAPVHVGQQSQAEPAATTIRPSSKWQCSVKGRNNHATSPVWRLLSSFLSVQFDFPW